MKQNHYSPPENHHQQPHHHPQVQQPQYQNHQHHQPYQYYHHINAVYFPHQGMVYPYPLQPHYGFSNPGYLIPYPVMLPAYSFTVNPRLPYYNYPGMVQENYVQPAILVPPATLPREYEENNSPYYHREGSIQNASSFESSSDDAEWFQESDDTLSNIRMRINFYPEEEVALIDLNLGEGQEPVMYDLQEELIAVMYDLQEELIADLVELVGPGDNNWMEETILRQLKTRKYQTPKAAKQVGEEEPEICVVCQSEYENQDTLAILECGHEYHANCIKGWLIRQNVCPLCKRRALPVPDEF